MQKELIKQGKLLPVMEEFYSIQGEGCNAGKASYFVRIGGCDVCCNWCDVKESWDADLHPLTDTDNIIDNIIKFPAKSVVITGGEPLKYNLDYLCSNLKDKNIIMYLETSGSYDMSGKWDWICLSPKRNYPPLLDIYTKANELKIIIHELSDLIWAEEAAKKVKDDVSLLLQPEWSKRKEMIPVIIDYILKNPKWIISVQLHKYLNIP